jgi:hypothetical protein
LPESCRLQVYKCPGAEYKSFNTLAEAQAYLDKGPTARSAAAAPSSASGRASQASTSGASTSSTNKSSRSTAAARPKRARPLVDVDEQQAADVRVKVARSQGPDVAATLYYDGGARGNPGPAGCGAVLYDGAGREIWRYVSLRVGPCVEGTTLRTCAFAVRVCRGAKYIGDHHTNNVAEYNGLVMGLEEALKRDVTAIT